MGAALTSGGLVVGGAFAFAAACSVLAPVPAVRAAQSATPVAAADAPHPNDCVVAPVGLPIALPPAATSTARLPDPASLPAGASADADTVAGVTATVREALACRNAGDLRRAYALMTPALPAGLLGTPETAPPEIIGLLLEPTDPVPNGERVALVAVSDVSLLPDGRVRARVETRAAGVRFADLLLFVHDGADAGGRWLIDDALPLGRQRLP